MTLKNRYAKFTPKDTNWEQSVDVTTGARANRSFTVVGGYVVSAGEEGNYEYSVDGKTWAVGAIPAVSSIASLATCFMYDGTYYYIGCSNGRLFRSATINAGWALVAASTFTTEDFMALCVNGALLSAVTRKVYPKTVPAEKSNLVEGYKTSISYYLSSDGGLTWVETAMPFSTPVVNTTSIVPFESIEMVFMKPYLGGFCIVVASIDTDNTNTPPYRFHGAVSVDGIAWTVIGGVTSASRSARQRVDMQYLPVPNVIGVFSRDKYSTSTAGGAWVLQTTLPAGDFFIASGVHGTKMYRIRYVNATKDYITESTTDGIVWTAETGSNLITLDQYIQNSNSILFYDAKFGNGTTAIPDLMGAYPAVVVDVNMTESSAPAWDAKSRLAVDIANGAGNSIYSALPVFEDIVCVGALVKRRSNDGLERIFGQWKALGDANGWVVGRVSTGAPNSNWFPTCSRTASPEGSVIHCRSDVSHAGDWVAVIVQWNEFTGKCEMWVNGVRQAVDGANNIFEYCRDNRLYFLSPLINGSIQQSLNGSFEFGFAKSYVLPPEEVKLVSELMLRNTVSGTQVEVPVGTFQSYQSAGAVVVSPTTVGCSSSPDVGLLRGEGIVMPAPKRTGKWGFSVTQYAAPDPERLIIGVASTQALKATTGITPALSTLRKGNGIVLSAADLAATGSGSQVVENVLATQPLVGKSQWEVVLTTLSTLASTDSGGMGIARADVVLQGTALNNSAIGWDNKGAAVYAAGPDYAYYNGASTAKATTMVQGATVALRFDADTGVLDYSVDGITWLNIANVPVAAGEVYYPALSLRGSTEKLTIKFAGLSLPMTAGYALVSNGTPANGATPYVGRDRKSWGFCFDGTKVHNGIAYPFSTPVVFGNAVELLMDFNTGWLSKREIGVDAAPVNMFRICPDEAKPLLCPAISVYNTANAILGTSITTPTYSKWTHTDWAKGYMVREFFNGFDGDAPPITLDYDVGHAIVIQNGAIRDFSASPKKALVPLGLSDPNQFVEVQVDGLNPDAGALVRFNAVDGYYKFGTNSGMPANSANLTHVDAGGAETVLATTAGGVTSALMTTRVEITGQGASIVIKCFVNGVLVLTHTPIAPYIINTGKQGYRLAAVTLDWLRNFLSGDL